ncbi:hypothetical protein [Gordonia aquimaris]|uniref:Uncharacterized protein n=1 Tax=Gordonia aquimaris TaxID=2984863 RepID=A0A9X3I5M0_9ACTN|nr:hypothetical protein [Gordonia aquimaris]MCX2965396.1 hypothetical protein [Gordonia aquimaris]
MLDLDPYVQSWMTVLAEQRPLFHSESDFQLALGLVLADQGMTQLRLEKKLSVSQPIGGRSSIYVDVLGELDGHRVALELKYPKKHLRACVGQEVFDLPASGAPDIDAAAIWRDAERIERLLLDDTVDAGASLTLTNYRFWSERSMTVRSQAHEFRLWEGRTVEPGTLRWQLKNGRQGEQFELQSPYQCRWHDFGDVCDYGFRYLLLQPRLRPQ